MANQNDDSAFEAYAREQEAAAIAAQQRSGGTNTFNYESMEWTGLETNRMKVIRAVGGPPDSKLSSSTARTVRVSSLIDDAGKKMRCILPERADDPEHLLWRIIARVKQVEWVDKKRVYPVELKHPQIFNIIAHNGFTAADKQFIFDRGWEGQEKLIMNVIDREQMDWHKQHKHTMLLSKSIGLGKDGTKFPEEGVPSYGFTSLLANLFKYYKNWEKYDIGITRTGLKEAPYRVINACKYIEEVPEDLQKYVINEPLSPEEAEWERYDLDKLFGVTKYTKIYNRMKLTIARIDAALGTHYLDELKDFADKEKAEFEATQAQAAPEAPAVEPTAPVASRKIASKAFDATALKGWNGLTESEKAAITGFTAKDGKVVAIQFADPDATLLACTECEVASPDNFTSCPNCAARFV